MTDQRSIESVLSELNISASKEEKEATLVAGKTTIEIATHHLATDIWVTGLTPSEVYDMYGMMYGGTQFDFEKLEESFTKICPDYAENIIWGSKYKSIQFAATVIYEIGPESRRLKNGDKIWKFRFITLDQFERKTVYGTVMVSTYKNSNPPTAQPDVKNNTLVISVKQASLLATMTLCAMLELTVTHRKEMMTPLAGAIFCKEDLPALMKDLRIENNVQNKASLIRSIISSCQSGGHHLKFSKCHIAVCAALCATKNMKDRRVAYDIVRKIMKEYHARNKRFAYDKFKIFCRHATGGIPPDFSSEKLFEEMEEIQRLNRKALKDLASTSSVACALPGLVVGDKSECSSLTPSTTASPSSKNKHSGNE